ncbi:MAG TPA: kelch repeat-containing protein [Gemmatimonadales bacterium]|nr:kelch repeat-containing protein [Gemmatimonadales bacterium]
MPENLWRYALAAGVVDNPAGQSTVYVFGGRYYQTPTDPPATTILAYNVATDSWTTKAAHFSGGATNGVGRIGDKLYISGGWDFTGTPDHWVDESSSLFAYDWVHDRVIRKADMPQPSGGGVTGVMNGKLYVLAGECFQQLCRDFYRYDPATNAWTTLPSAPNFHWQGAGVVLNGKFYVAGGGPSPRRSFDVYDPATNTWTALDLMPPRKPIAVGATAQGKVYVIGIGGDDRKEGVDRNTVAYYPPTNSWANKAPFPGPQGEGGQFLLHPAAALRVLLDGRAGILTVGSGHLYSDGTVKPAGTIDPAPPYLYTP